jgi:hypothetical protein
MQYNLIVLKFRSLSVLQLFLEERLRISLWAVFAFLHLRA